MKKRFSLRYFLLICIVFLIATFVLGAFVFPRTKRSDSVISTLLLAKNVPLVETITISDSMNDTHITLTKKTNDEKIEWTAYSSFLFPADGTIVENFIDTLSQKRTLFVFSKNSSAWKSLLLDTENALQVRAEAQNATILCDVFFGIENYNSKRISLRTARDVTVFQTENNLYPYLKTDPSWWANMQLFPVSFSASDIQRITFNTDTRYVRSSVQSSAELENYTRILTGSRGTHIVPYTASDFTAADFDVLRLELGNGTTEYITIYHTNGEIFYVRPNTAQYCLEISSWTYSRLTEGL